MFEITVKEIKTVKKLAGQEWVVVGTREVARANDFITDENSQPTRIENVYGYSPAIEKSVDSSNVVFNQVVESLDLSAVIRAINGL